MLLPSTPSGAAMLYAGHSELHAALFTDNQISAHFQPIVDFHGRLYGCEALARWELPDGSNISPAKFIPTAESSGLSMSLGELILQQAAEAQARLVEADRSGVYVSVNFSLPQIIHPHFETAIQNVLENTKIRPECLIFELTESADLLAAPQVAEVLQRISTMGIRLAVDDYGAGYSCLAYLLAFPISILKIDRCLVGAMLSNPTAKAILKSTISLAQDIGAIVVAEGVESLEQQQLLQDIGPCYMQGYLFGKAMPLEDMLAHTAPPVC